MDPETYEAIVRAVALPVSATPHFELLARQFQVGRGTIHSIYNAEIQSRVMRRHPELLVQLASLVQRFLAGEDLLDLAFEVDTPPCILLRRVLEVPPFSLSRPAIRAALQNPDSCAGALGLGSLEKGRDEQGKEAGDAGRDEDQAFSNRASSDQASSNQASFALAHAHPAPVQRSFSIDPARLASTIAACVACDAVYSPACDLARHSAGREFEARLESFLAAAGVPHWTETQLRAKGFVRTPDARLQVPLALRGHVVHWVDSKATFGDARTHAAAAEQFTAYVNRFGAGMVIYWHGFLRGVQPEGKGVLLLDRPPEQAELVLLPRLEVDAELAVVEGGRGGEASA